MRHAGRHTWVQYLGAQVCQTCYNCAASSLEIHAPAAFSRDQHALTCLSIATGEFEAVINNNGLPFSAVYAHMPCHGLQ